MRFPRARTSAEREALRQTRRPVDAVLGITGGASSRGSTYYKALRTCPRAAALREAGLVRTGGGSESLDTGLLFHAGLEAFYGAVKLWQDTFAPGHFATLSPAETVPARYEAEVWGRLNDFAAEPGYAATFSEVERLLGAYFESYRGLDHWRILAVEETLEYAVGDLEFTARLDLVVYDYATKGVWVIEHKTSKALTETLMSGYQLDFQTLGQCWLVDRCVDLDALGPFQGIVVNIVTKAKQPKIARVPVCPSRQHLVGFEQSLRMQTAVAAYARQLGAPRWIGNCSGPAQYFGACDYFDLCHGRPTDTLEETLAGDDPPFGFTREMKEDV